MKPVPKPKPARPKTAKTRPLAPDALQIEESLEATIKLDGSASDAGTPLSPSSSAQLADMVKQKAGSPNPYAALRRRNKHEHLLRRNWAKEGIVRPKSGGIRLNLQSGPARKDPDALTHSARAFPTWLAFEAESPAQSDPYTSSSFFVGKRRLTVKVPHPYDPQQPAQQPELALDLSHVYGYNSRDDGPNLFRGPGDDEVVYNVAAVGLVHNCRTQGQRHFTEHDEDVTCLAVSSDRKYVATGQSDPKGFGRPYICVWTATTMKLRAKICYHMRNVKCVAFSNDGELLVSVGADDSHTGAVWQWKKNTDVPLLEYPFTKSPVWGVTCSIDVVPQADPQETEVLNFCSFGEKIAKVHHIVQPTGSSAYMFRATILTGFERTGITQAAFPCAAYTKNCQLAVGCSSGHIYLYDAVSHDLIRFFQVFKDVPCSAISINRADTVMVCAGKGEIKWFPAVKKTELHSMPLTFLTVPKPLGKVKATKEVIGVRSICIDEPAEGPENDASIVLVGTTTGEIHRVDKRDGSARVVAVGIGGAESWALSVHPTNSLFACGNDDGEIRFMDFASKTVHSLLRMACAVKCMCLNQEATRLAVGLEDGSIGIIDVATGNLLYSGKLCGEQVSCICFSPDGKKVACGSWDQCIVVLDAHKKITVLKGHTSSVVKLQFSDNGLWLMSNSRDYDILVWDVKNAKRLGHGVPANTTWVSWNCILGWPLQGIYAGLGDGTDINCVCLSGSDGNQNNGGKRIIICGDDFGSVTVLKYPSLSSADHRLSHKGHSSHVTEVKATSDTKWVFSLGGRDLSVFQWAVVPHVPVEEAEAEKPDPAAAAPAW